MTSTSLAAGRFRFVATESSRVPSVVSWVMHCNDPCSEIDPCCTCHSMLATCVLHVYSVVDDTMVCCWCSRQTCHRWRLMLLLHCWAPNLQILLSLYLCPQVCCSASHCSDASDRLRLQGLNTVFACQHPMSICTYPMSIAVIVSSCRLISCFLTLHWVAVLYVCFECCTNTRSEQCVKLTL